jgi:hypothetical protein
MVPNAQMATPQCPVDSDQQHDGEIHGPRIAAMGRIEAVKLDQPVHRGGRTVSQCRRLCGL